MKRFLFWFPFVGLLLLGIAITVRSVGFDGLGLLKIPDPPQLELSGYAPGSRVESVSGRITTNDGLPVAEVLVMTEHNGELSWSYSDPEGRFHLSRLPAGPLQLSLMRRMQNPQVFQVNAPAADLELIFENPAPGLPSLPDIEDSDLEGEVLAGIPGRGLLGYEVQLIPVQLPQTLGAPIPVRARVGADRRFRFPDLLHGQYQVRVLPPWAVGGTWPNLIDPAQELFEQGPATKAPAFRLACGEIAGRLIDTKGRVVAGAFVRVTPLGRPQEPCLPHLSGPSGEFQVSDLPPGTYTLEIDAGEARYSERIEVQAGVTSRVDVHPLELRRGQLENRS